MKVVLDSNVIIYAVRFGVDLGALKPAFVPESVRRELEMLSRKGGRTGTAARVALRICERLPGLPSPTGKADDDLVHYALEGYAVATQDSELRKRIEGLGGKVIYLRQNKYFEGIE